MGSALARALQAGGRRVAVWNRDLTKAERLRGESVQVCNSLEEAVAASGCVVVCLTGYGTWRRLVSGIALPVLEGRIVVQLSNGAPDEAQSLRDLHAGLGVVSLDGSILGWPSQVGSPRFPVTISGDAHAFAQVAPLLAPLGDVQFVGEPISTSSALEAALVFFTNASLVCYLQAAVLVRAAGIPHAELAKRIGSAMPALKWLIGESDRAIVADDHRGVDATVQTYLESFRDLQGYVNRMGLPEDVIGAFVEVMQKAIQAGRGQEEISALYDILQPGVLPQRQVW